LPLRIAAVELINVLRPTVAISWYIAFAAHALHANAECRQRLQEPQAFESDGYAQRFVRIDSIRTASVSDNPRPTTSSRKAAARPWVTAARENGSPFRR
jgi:hypothetical protein